MDVLPIIESDPDTADTHQRFELLKLRLLLERQTGMPRWHLTSPHIAETEVNTVTTLDVAAEMDEVEDEEDPPPMSRQEYVITEAEHLIGTDEPDSIAHRLGYARGAVLERVLTRYGRPDLARSLRRVA